MKILGVLWMKTSQFWECEIVERVNVSTDQCVTVKPVVPQMLNLFFWWMTLTCIL